MTATRYLLRSLAHFRFAYLGVLAGAVLGATVLFGALFSGDSVEKSLREIGAKRTGQATHLVAAGDRFFRAALADDLAAAAKVRAAPVLYARGTVAHAGTQAVANQVQLVGVTDTFWQLAPKPATVDFGADNSAVAVNDTLARRLRISVGDTVIVRLQKPGILAGNAPVAGAASSVDSLRCKVTAVVNDAAFGRFSLESTQVPPVSIFLPIKRLQESLGNREGANLLLVDRSRSNADLARVLAESVRLGDYGLSLKWLERAGVFELSSKRIFIDPEMTAAATSAAAGTQPVVSYLVNEVRLGDRATPYSIAAATTHEAAPFLPPDLGPDEIVLNQWLADDLQARSGDEVRLKFYQAGASGVLVEQSAAFRVKSITPLEGLAADSAWMPDFPGISDAKRQGDWNSGLPLDLDRLRDKDERYWDTYRGAPKAFLSIAGGRNSWSTRWGDTTALRIPYSRDREPELTAALLRALRPEMNHLVVRGFGASAQESAKSAVDFGGLFIGMSFFLILAALGLVAMLFQFCLLQRNREDALLAAVGISPRQLLRWRLAEGGTIALLGCALGLPLAVIYTRGILNLIASIWTGQGGATGFLFAASPASIAAGGGGFLMLALFAIWLAIRKLNRRALSIRLAAHAEETTALPSVRRSSIVIAGGALVLAAVAIAFSGRGLSAQIGFYLAGFALLAAGMAIARWSFAKSAATERDAPLDAAYIGGLNVKARRSRSLTVVGLIATAVFMVLSVASFRKHVGDDWLERTSGTGGFALWLETTAALNPARDTRAKGFEIFEPLAADLGDVVALRAGMGDNANCFNLNATLQPKLLAVDSTKLAARKAFPVKTAASAERASAWTALGKPAANGAMPAFVDETTLQWVLKKKIGDTLSYTDDNGRAFQVQIAGTLSDSLFQGYLVVDETLFLKKFPSNPGYSVFLIDARKTSLPEIAALKNRLQTASRDAGGNVDLTRDVLAAFHEIENTYIAIFNVLGSLGVMLGSLGLAIVVARNLRERAGEFAVMTAMGIPRPVLARMVFSEFSRLVVWGIAIGAIASAIAVWPGLRELPALPTLALVAGLLAGIVALNLVSGWLIFRRTQFDPRLGVAQAVS